MSLTKIGSIGINTGIAFAGVTTIATLNGSDSVLSVGGTVNFVSDVSIGGTVSIAGTLTYEDVTNVDAVGLITARDGINVGSGITLSVDGDIFATGVVTATTFSGAFSGDGSALTGVANTDVIFTDKLTLPDSAAGSINVGLASDLQIYHDGTDSKIVNATNDLILQSTGDDVVIRASDDLLFYVDTNDAAIVARNNAEVDLRYNGNVKLATSNSGVTVTGTVAATSYTGDGSSLTGIEVGITTESASISGITTYLNLSKDDHELVLSGTNTISVIGGSQGSSHTLRLQNSGIATVTLDSTYFKFASGATPSLPTADGAISLVSFTIHKAGAVGVNTVLLTGASVSFS